MSEVIYITAHLIYTFIYYSYIHVDIRVGMFLRTGGVRESKRERERERERTREREKEREREGEGEQKMRRKRERESVCVYVCE